MSRAFSLLILMAVCALSMTAPLAAQTRSAVSVADLDAAVAERPSAVREAVRGFLVTDRAQELAGRAGTTVAELSERVAGLDDGLLNGFAGQAGIPAEDLAGGADTIVITASTAIIILLLIIILVK